MIGVNRAASVSGPVVPIPSALVALDGADGDYGGIYRSPDRTLRIYVARYPGDAKQLPTFYEASWPSPT